MPLISDQMGQRLRDLNKIRESYDESIHTFDDIATSSEKIAGKARKSSAPDLKKLGETCFALSREYLLLCSMVEHLVKNYDETLFMNTSMATFINITKQEKDFAEFFSVFEKQIKAEKTAMTPKKLPPNVVKLKPKKK